MKKYFVSLAFILFLSASVSYACTSVIVSGKYTSSGRPIMYKNRDTGNIHNRMEHFRGPEYSFIGLVNSGDGQGSVWAGTNEAGFCIMNTASYNLKDDDIPEKDMGMEGRLMHAALGVCASISDFEHFLDTLTRPMLVETNIGVIDASGGASYYEVCNYSWRKYDVNDPGVAPDGYFVVTNFSNGGRPEDARGVERFKTASVVMKEYASSHKGKGFNPGHEFIFNKMSRSYRHEFMGVDYSRRRNLRTLKNGYAVDQDFIPRINTSASVVFEGVCKGESPLHTVMWTILGYPACGTAVPLLPAKADNIPYYMKSIDKAGNCYIDDISFHIKDKYVFTETVSNGSHYFNIRNVIKGSRNLPSLLECARKSDKMIMEDFNSIYVDWVEGNSSDEEFYSAYEEVSDKFIMYYETCFSPFIQ